MNRLFKFIELSIYNILLILRVICISPVFGSMSRFGRIGAWSLPLLLLLAPAPALAAAEEPLARPLSMAATLAILALVPVLLVMMTSYAKIAVVLHILRSALGHAQVPPALVITGLALVLSVYVMAPTGIEVYEAVRPELSDLPPEGPSVQALLVAASKAKGPVAEFLFRNSPEAERRLFQGLARRNLASAGAVPGDHDLLVLLPAFAIGQLKAAFLIGFFLFIPFLVIDLVVANLLLTLGMNLVAPQAMALPFKLLLFVLVDGWSLLARGLVLSYG